MTDDEVTSLPEFMRVYFGSNGGYFRAVPIVGEIYALRVATANAEYATLELIKIKEQSLGTGLPSCSRLPPDEEQSGDRHPDEHGAA